MSGKSLGKRYNTMVFGVCPCTPRTPKFWYTYMMMYDNFMIIVKPWKDVWYI